MKYRCCFTDVCAAYGALVLTHLLLACGGFGRLYKVVRSWPVRLGARRDWHEQASRVLAAVVFSLFYIEDYAGLAHQRDAR